MKYTESFWSGNPCNECKSSENVKVIEIGSYRLFLCKNCREELRELLSILLMQL